MWSGSTCPSPALGAAPDSPPKNSLAEPSPHQHKGPGSSWGQAQVTQPPHGHQKGWTGFPRAPAASGFLLCFAAAPVTSLSSSALSPTQSDILHSAAVPSPTGVPWPGGSLSPSQLGQKGNRTSVTAAWGPLRPPLYGFQPYHCPCQHDKTSSKRWHLRAEPVPGDRAGGEHQPLCPPGLSAGDTSLALVLPAISRRWKNTENSLFFKPQLPRSMGSLQSRDPEPRAGKSCWPGSSRSRSCPESLSGRLDGKAALMTHTATGRAAVMSAGSKHGIAYKVQQRGVLGTAQPR